MNGTISQNISDALLAKVEKLRPYLERTGGSIRPRRRDGVYGLRIRAEDPDRGRVHRRITLGDEQTAYAVQALIDAWREERAAREAEEERRREEGRVYEAKVKQIRKTLLAAAGGSGRRKRRAREFDRAAGDPVTLYAYLLAGLHPLTDLRPGPKRRGGLC